MLRVGLTGGIATGKSTLSRYLKVWGAKVIDADSVAHELQRPGTQIWEAIIDAFGRRILSSDGITIDRRRLGEIVFSDPRLRAVLEQVMHPAIIAQEETRMSQWERSGRVEVAIVEAALLIESGFFRRFHRIVVVVASEETQMGRLLRKGLTEKEALLRIRAQMPLAEKARYAHYLIDNSGDRSQLESQAKELFIALGKDANDQAVLGFIARHPKRPLS